MTRSIPGAALFTILSVAMGMTARAQDSGAPAAAVKPTQVPTVDVIGTREHRGTAEEGYRVDSLNSLGPLGTSKILDLPYTIGNFSAHTVRSPARHSHPCARLAARDLARLDGSQALRP